MLPARDPAKNCLWGVSWAFVGISIYIKRMSDPIQPFPLMTYSTILFVGNEFDGSIRKDTNQSDRMTLEQTNHTTRLEDVSPGFEGTSKRSYDQTGNHMSHPNNLTEAHTAYSLYRHIFQR
jgi:hypothetical protein